MISGNFGVNNTVAMLVRITRFLGKRSSPYPPKHKFVKDAMQWYPNYFHQNKESLKVSQNYSKKEGRNGRKQHAFPTLHAINTATPRP